MQDRPGVLNRAVSLFRRRGFNIDSLSVASTERPGLSRMTVVVNQDDVAQVVQQLQRLVDIVSVDDVTFDRAVAQEMCLVRLGPPGNRIGDLLAVAGEYKARVIDASTTSIVLAVMDLPSAISMFLDRLRPFGIEELTRSGRIAMAVGAPQRTGRQPRATSALQVHEAIPAGSFQWQADGFADDDAAA